MSLILRYKCQNTLNTISCEKLHIETRAKSTHKEYEVIIKDGWKTIHIIKDITIREHELDEANANIVVGLINTWLYKNKVHLVNYLKAIEKYRDKKEGLKVAMDDYYASERADINCRGLENGQPKFYMQHAGINYLVLVDVDRSRVNWRITATTLFTETEHQHKSLSLPSWVHKAFIRLGRDKAEESVAYEASKKCLSKLK